MSKAFFESKEFLLFVKIRTRVVEMHTPSNHSFFLDSQEKCRKLAETHNNIGYNKDTNKYRWDDVSIEDAGPIIVKMEMQIIPGFDAYVSEAYDKMVFRCKEMKVLVTFEGESLEQIREKSIRDLSKIIIIKKEFEGELLGTEAGNKARRSNKKVAKQSKYVPFF